MKVIEIFEEIKWAVEDQIDNATSAGKHYQNDKDYTLVWVDIADLFSKIDKMQKIDLKTGEGQIKGRISRATKHWEEGGYMDPATVGFNEWHKIFNFVDGRHRLVTAYQAGEKWAPVLFPTDQLDIVYSNLNTR